jgi:hypothetical protein
MLGLAWCPEAEPPPLGELERRAVQVTERTQPGLLVGSGGVADGLGREGLEQLERVVLGGRLEGVEEGDERGGPAWLRQARHDGRLHALPEVGQAKEEHRRKARGDDRPDRPGPDGIEPLEAADQLCG